MKINLLPSNSTTLAQTLEENARFLILTGNKSILSAQSILSYVFKPRLRIKLKTQVSPLCALVTEEGFCSLFWFMILSRDAWCSPRLHRKQTFNLALWILLSRRSRLKSFCISEFSFKSTQQLTAHQDTYLFFPFLFSKLDSLLLSASAHFLGIKCIILVAFHSEVIFTRACHVVYQKQKNYSKRPNLARQTCHLLYYKRI